MALRPRRRKQAGARVRFPFETINGSRHKTPISGTRLDQAMKMQRMAALAVGLVLGAAGASAQAGEVLIGVYGHGLGVHQSQEGGVDALLGYRTDKINALWWLGKPSVHVIVAGNSNVPTDFIAVGFDWKIRLFSDRLYLRPGIGFAGTTGEAQIPNGYAPGLSPAQSQRDIHLSDTRIDFGSHDLFEPEMALGYKITPKWSAELSWVHLSNGEILHHGENQGLDDVGLRIAYHFGR